jgi:cold shock CspA family protein
LRLFDHQRSYGFFSTGDPRRDVFVHGSVFRAAGIMHPTSGRMYEYEARESSRKPGKLEAVAVYAIQDGPQADQELTQVQTEIAWLERQAEQARRVKPHADSEQPRTVTPDAD